MSLHTRKYLSKDYTVCGLVGMHDIVLSDGGNPPIYSNRRAVSALFSHLSHYDSHHRSVRR